MATLLLRLAGPLQAWGTESKFETRRTLGFPTKSGVIGMIAAALGYSRTESLDELNKLKFGLRIDREGNYLNDYHTAHGKKEKDAYITHRFYLMDAIFLVGLESDDRDYLDYIDSALKQPAFPLFLGRRSCPPTMPLTLGIREKDLLTSLKTEPWLLADWRQKYAGESERALRIITDADDSNNATVLRDLAISFDPKHRKHTFRYVKDQGYLTIKMDEVQTEHDAFSELG